MLGLSSPTVHSVLTILGVVRLNILKKTDYEPYSTPSYPEDGRTGGPGTLKPSDIIYQFSCFNC